MNIQQLIRLDKTLIVTTLVMLLFEIVFSIPAINNFFVGWVTNTNSWVVWVILWVLMFLQTNIIPLPAVTLLSASMSIGINILSVPYFLVVISAYMTGAIVTYWLGRKFGTKAVKWIAGDNDAFNKWCTTLNCKTAKGVYFLTVLLAGFPDDILCLCAGSIKMDFKFFVLANAIGRSIGLITMLVFLTFIGKWGSSSGIPILAIVWAVCLLAELIAYVILIIKCKKRKDNENNRGI